MTTLTVPTTARVYSVAKKTPSFSFLTPSDDSSLEERVTLLLMRDLVRLGWRLKSSTNHSFEFVPPEIYDKQVVRNAMAYARNEVLERDAEWIGQHLNYARSNLARGSDVLKSKIKPRIEICETPKSHDLFRLYRYYWSSPYSEYVGRRMRLLIRDDGIKGSPVIGIAALGSSIIHIPDRDNWIGWNKAVRSNRIIYMMDAYVIGALPPYNDLLGGKLIAYILASNEIRKLFRKKYLKKKTIIQGRKASDFVLLITSSLYGTNSSQYNRLKYKDELLYQPIGKTTGFGSLHISNETFSAMKALIENSGQTISHEFGNGPNWRMRVIRTACNLLDLDAEVILNHSFQRGLYGVPLATNWKEFLQGNDKKPIYKDLPLKDLVDFWHDRWFLQRLNNEEVIQRVNEFDPNEFDIQITAP